VAPCSAFRLIAPIAMRYFSGGGELGGTEVSAKSSRVAYGLRLFWWVHARRFSDPRRQGIALGARETKWQGNEVRKSNFSFKRHVQSIGRHNLEFRPNYTFLMSSSASLRTFTLLYGKRRALLEAQPSHLTPKTA
jgi:hypothetical protein